MTFGAPLWLIALAPLAGVVVYLFWGRRRQEHVPFLDLWVGPVKSPRPRRQFAAPPIAVALAILAMLLGIVGAARPALWDPHGGPPLTVIVDRGASMSATDAWVALTEAVQQELIRLGQPLSVDLFVVPGSVRERTDLMAPVSRVTDLPPTAVDTTDAVRAAVARRLAESGGPVVVISDRPLNSADERVVPVAPRKPVQNLGLTHMAARASPRPQVMVRVRNEGVPTRLWTEAVLRIWTAGKLSVSRFPSHEGSRDHFIDLDPIGETVKVELEFNDSFRGDNTAWLVREGSAPLFERQGELPPELRRMIDVYSTSRPPSAESPRVTIVRDEPLPRGTAGVVVAGAGDSIRAASAEVRPHPATRDTRWSLGGSVRLAPPPGEGWTPVVSFGGRPAVAVRDAPARQVWVGVDSDEWPRTPDYVVFWANVFDWLGAAETRFASYPVGRLEGMWKAVELAQAPERTAAAMAAEPGLWPGLYERADDGARRAVNAGDVQFPTRAADDWKPRLAQALAAHRRGAARPVSAGVLLAALACAGLSVATWKRSPRRNLAAT